METMLEKREGTFDHDSRKPTPVDRLMADLPGVFYKLSEVAQMLGLSEVTLRRLIRKGVTTAPSHTLRHGGMQMYLYTPEDVEELRRYYQREPERTDESRGSST